MSASTPLPEGKVVQRESWRLQPREPPPPPPPAGSAPVPRPDRYPGLPAIQFPPRGAPQAPPHPSSSSSVQWGSTQGPFSARAAPGGQSQREAFAAARDSRPPSASSYVPAASQNDWPSSSRMEDMAGPSSGAWRAKDWHREEDGGGDEDAGEGSSRRGVRSERGRSREGDDRGRPREEDSYTAGETSRSYRGYGSERDLDGRREKGRGKRRYDDDEEGEGRRERDGRDGRESRDGRDERIERESRSGRGGYKDGREERERRSGRERDGEEEDDRRRRRRRDRRRARDDERSRSRSVSRDRHHDRHQRHTPSPTRSPSPETRQRELDRQARKLARRAAKHATLAALDPLVLALPDGADAGAVVDGPRKQRAYSPSAPVPPDMARDRDLGAPAPASSVGEPAVPDSKHSEEYDIPGASSVMGSGSKHSRESRGGRKRKWRRSPDYERGARDRSEERSRSRSPSPRRKHRLSPTPDDYPNSLQRTKRSRHKDDERRPTSPDGFHGRKRSRSLSREREHRDRDWERDRGERKEREQDRARGREKRRERSEDERRPGRSRDRASERGERDRSRERGRDSSPRERSLPREAANGAPSRALSPSLGQSYVRATRETPQYLQPPTGPRRAPPSGPRALSGSPHPNHQAQLAHSDAHPPPGGPIPPPRAPRSSPTKHFIPPPRVPLGLNRRLPAPYEPPSPFQGVKGPNPILPNGEPLPPGLSKNKRKALRKKINKKVKMDGGPGGEGGGGGGGNDGRGEGIPYDESSFPPIPPPRPPANQAHPPTSSRPPIPSGPAGHPHPPHARPRPDGNTNANGYGPAHGWAHRKVDLDIPERRRDAPGLAYDDALAYGSGSSRAGTPDQRRSSPVSRESGRVAGAQVGQRWREETGEKETESKAQPVKISFGAAVEAQRSVTSQPIAKFFTGDVSPESSRNLAPAPPSPHPAPTSQATSAAAHLAALQSTTTPFLQAAYRQWASQGAGTSLHGFMVTYLGREPEEREVRDVRALWSAERRMEQESAGSRAGQSQTQPQPRMSGANAIGPADASRSRWGNNYTPGELQAGGPSASAVPVDPRRRRDSQLLAEPRAAESTTSSPALRHQPNPAGLTPSDPLALPTSTTSTPPPATGPPFNPSGDMYERLAAVGEGTYGKVYKARANDTGMLVALKRIRMEGEKDGFPVTAMREIKVLQSLRHENVLRLLEMVVSHGGSVSMVLEYMDHDLTGLLAHPTLIFTPANLKSLSYQMLSGLNYMHHRGILHRDMKGSNILLNSRGELKLADFGLARRYDKKRGWDYTNRVITLWYRSPELLLGETVYGAEVDMWSAGCIILELFTSKPVFQGSDEIDQLTVIYSILGTPREVDWPAMNELPWYELVKPREVVESRFREMFAETLSPAALDLVEGLLYYDPVKRLSASAALKTAYFLTEDPPMEKPTQLAGIGEHHEMSAKAERRRKRVEEWQ
ncbi:hypothetical protein IAT38_007047 [Cryptococcus sp. DSM 104549]